MSRLSAEDFDGLPTDSAGSAKDFIILRALVEDASEAGARRALALLGLQDDDARRDMDQLRELLGSWRDVKRTAWQSVTRCIVRILLATLLIGLALRQDLFKLLES